MKRFSGRLTNSGEEHDTKANEYRKLVSYSVRTQKYVFFIYMAEGKSKHKIHARSLKKALGRFQLGLQV